LIDVGEIGPKEFLCKEEFIYFNGKKYIPLKNTFKSGK